MKLLHTSDWHVGKTIRGRSRIDEHRAVLAEIVGLVKSHEVDLVLVAGDLFETAAPTAESEQLVYSTLLDLARTGAEVAIISGNHDNARRLEALSPVFEAAKRFHMLTRPVPAEVGGVRNIALPTGVDVTLAMVPFVSKRGIVRATDLWEKEAFEAAQQYAERVGNILSALAESFRADTVNLMMAHTFVHGVGLGGGERKAHFIEEYAISTPQLPIDANYIALGHVHRPQKIAAGAPAHYCGSPLQLDFGEAAQVKQVNVVEVEPGVPAKVTPVPLSAGRPLSTVSGTVDELRALKDSIDDDAWLRVVVKERGRSGLAEEVRGVLGERVVDVRVESNTQARRRSSSDEPRVTRAPAELFAEFMGERGIADDRVMDAFKRLLDQALEEPV